MPALPKIDVSQMPNVVLPSADQVIDFFEGAAVAGSGIVSLTAEKVAELHQHLVEALKIQVDTFRAAV